MQFADKYVVLVITRDHQTFIADCLASIVSQSNHKIPIVVIDTGSLDETSENAERFLANSGWLYRIYKMERGATTLQALAHYASLESPNWISLISGDDAFGDLYFEQAGTFIEAYPEGALGFSKLKVCDNKLSAISERKSAWGLSRDAILKQLQYSNPGNTPGVILPWKKIVQSGIFNSIPPILIEDYWLWWQLQDKFDFKNLNESKVKYRRHELNLTKQRKNKLYAFSLGYCTGLPLLHQNTFATHFRNVLLVTRWIRHISPIYWSNFFLGRKQVHSNTNLTSNLR